MDELIRQKVFIQTQTQKLEKVAQIFDEVLERPFEPEDEWAKRHNKPAPKKRLGWEGAMTANCSWVGGTSREGQ